MKTKKIKPKKTKKRRVVLGVGFPWFDKRGGPGMEGVGYQKVMLIGVGTEVLTLNIEDLGAYNKIRLIAEVIS